MATAQEIRQRIADGTLKKTTGGGSVGVGSFAIVVESAEFGVGESGGKRGKLVCRVLGAADTSEVGKHFNYYLQTKDQGYMERQIAEFADYCKTWGVDEARLYDRAETGEDIVVNMMMEMNRLALKGVLLAEVDRKLSGKTNARGQPQYWVNWMKVGLATTPVAMPEPPKDPSAPMTPAMRQALVDAIPSEKAAVAAKVTLGNVLDSSLPPAASVAPVAAPAVVPATSTVAKKPWQI